MIKSEILNTAEKYSRLVKITKGRKLLSTPTYFPAISGFGLGFDSKDFLNFVVASDYPRVLISSYDVSTYHGNGRLVLSRLNRYFRDGAFVMIDSGVFESYWRRDNSWNFAKYRKIVSTIDSDFYVGFDVLPRRNGPLSGFLGSAYDQIKRCSGLSNKGELVPVIHGPNPKHLIWLFKRLAQTIENSTRIVAVPERECGYSLIERARTILQIRRILNKVDERIVLHILGCGNPVSLALYVYCGADMFDSLDWSKITINRDNLAIVDLSQLELLNCKCKICSARIKGVFERTLLHNLLFYQDFSLQIQKMVRRDTLWDFLVEYVGLRNLNKLGD